MKNIETFFSMFGKLVKILNGKQKRDGIILFLLLIIVSFLEMLGVSVIVPLIITMLEPDKLMINKYVAPIVKLFGISDYNKFIYIIAATMVVIYVLKNGFILFVNYYQSKYRNRLEKDLNVKMLDSYLKHPYTFWLRTNSADVIRGVNGDVTSVASVIDGYSGILSEGLTCLIIGIFLIYISPFMAVSLLIVTIVTSIGIIMCFKGLNGKCGATAREAFAEKFKSLNQTIGGIKEISVAQRKPYFLEQFSVASKKASDCNTTYLCISKAPSRIIETVFICGLIIVVVISFNLTDDSVDFITSLGAIAVAAVRILPSISNLTHGINSLVYMRPSLEAAYKNISEADKYQREVASVENNNIEKVEFNSEIRVNSLSWRYQEKLSLVLEDLDLEIKKGESVALIGESGAGKSTLADILLGLLKPEKGTVTVDGVDIYTIQSSWSKLIGYVPQMVFLIDDTIRKNIAFGISDDEIDDNKVWHAIEQAQLTTMVNSMEEGLDSIVGERGIKLSGGQRQRIAIARALYHNPDIIILDEATSALDNETESAVMEAIEALQGKKTLIIIAHRLSTIKNCDKVYEIKDKKALLKDK
jgi:ABC-type multidrug transport system fused ATPase/permease subunit